MNTEKLKHGFYWKADPSSPRGAVIIYVSSPPPGNPHQNDAVCISNCFSGENSVLSEFSFTSSGYTGPFGFFDKAHSDFRKKHPIVPEIGWYVFRQEYDDVDDAPCMTIFEVERVLTQKTFRLFWCTFTKRSKRGFVCVKDQPVPFSVAEFERMKPAGPFKSENEAKLYAGEIRLRYLKEKIEYFSEEVENLKKEMKGLRSSSSPVDFDLIENLDELIDFVAFGDIYECGYHFADDVDNDGEFSVRLPVNRPEELKGAPHTRRLAPEDELHYNILACLVAFKEGRLCRGGYCARLKKLDNSPEGMADSQTP